MRAARTRGFTDVKVQSNGLVYAQARNVEALLSAGVSRFHVSIHTHEAAAYEALVRRAGTFALLEAGLANLVAQGVTLVADLIYTPLETPFLAAARSRGCVTVNGLGLLLNQARLAFKAWFGVLPDITPELLKAVHATF